MEMFWCKVFSTKYEIVVAICDENLIDKEIGTKELKVKISKNFYGEKIIDERMALRLMQKATICNLMGRNIVELAEKNKFIIKENVIFINGIPHAQFVKI
jgi:hypothetical protein